MKFMAEILKVFSPFDGHKASGLGVGGILPAMEEMTEEKLVIFKSAAL